MSQSDMHNTQELHARVRGWVQGVGFRYFVMRQASFLGLRGYVRNENGGDVAVVAQGPRPALERLLAELRRGPSAAEVEQVQVSWQEPGEHFSGFHIRY